MLVAEDELTNQQIADRLAVGPKTITTWKQHPDFRSRVEQHIDELLERARRRGLARLDKRQNAQFDRHDRMRALLEARATGTVRDVPGSSTGLVVTRERSIGSGDSQQVVVEHGFDAALMREFRELEKQIAQDAGQWTEKRQVTGTVTFADVVALASEGGDQ